MLAIGIASSIMANQAAFAFLLAYTCSVLLLLPRGEQWGSSANSPHQIRSSLIKPLQKLLFCCQVWHTNTSTHITTAHRHAPKKHIRKKLIPFAVTLQQKFVSGCRTSALHRTNGDTSSQVSFSSISYRSNVGTSTQTTITTALHLITTGQCHHGTVAQSPHSLVFDCGRGLAVREETAW